PSHLLFFFTSHWFNSRPYNQLFFSNGRKGVAMTIIRTAEALQQSTESYVFLDVRTKTEQIATGKEAYDDSHIPGASFLDLKRDLSGNDSFLPDPTAIAETLGALGIDENTSIVLYDQRNQRAASRAWYVLYYLGHQDVYILQG